MNKRIEELEIEQSIKDITNDLTPDKANKFHTLIRRMNHFNNLNKLEEVNTSIGSFSRVFGRTKLLLTILIISMVGFLIGAFFTSFYFKVLQSNTPEFHFVPNRIAVRKPAYVQLLKTQAEVDLVKKTQIMDADMASIGAVVAKYPIGLAIIPLKEMQTPSYHLKWVDVQKDKSIQVGDYHFVPNSLFTKDPIFIQVILTDSDLEAAKKLKNLHDKNLLEIGAAINESNNGFFVTAKSVLAEKYSLVKPIDTLNSFKKAKL